MSGEYAPAAVWPPDSTGEQRASAVLVLRGRILSAVRTFGRTVRLGVRATVLAATDLAAGRFPLREAVVQAWFFASVSLLPAVLISLPMGVVIAVQVGSLTENVGAGSMAGAVGGMGVLQQIAPLAAALLVGGAGASAIASDLGARTIREEIDALRTMGIDPHRRLVAPRVVAMTVVAPMLAVLVILMSILASFLVASVGQGVAPGSYWLSFGSFASVTDLVICLGKSAVFGYLVAVIASQRGLQAQGGPKGVADCVNAAVVLGLLACLVVNLIITQIVLLFVPMGLL
ncbi:Probable phospholipid ABC transporter permease protein mlaE [Nocardia farcinica]|uniref:Probable phospholipid ABC transporter permease protein mlaE n=1 Tax=Nocardia farcinica TaxID=37329 RepID=A0A449GEF0_NOCFR|nr:Probable phospholipid ABC transporter permease protein mlaE [Nocardia farcinica]